MLGIAMGEMVVVGSATAAATAVIARRKGYSPLPFVLLGAVLNVVGIAIALLMPYKQNRELQDEALRAQTLSNYKRLLDEGAISQEEYDAKKSDLL